MGIKNQRDTASYVAQLVPYSIQLVVVENPHAEITSLARVRRELPARYAKSGR